MILLILSKIKRGKGIKKIKKLFSDSRSQMQKGNAKLFLLKEPGVSVLFITVCFTTS